MKQPLFGDVNMEQQTLEAPKLNNAEVAALKLDWDKAVTKPAKQKYLLCGRLLIPYTISDEVVPK